MGYSPATMRRRTVVAAAAIIAAFALAGLPVPAGSRTPSATRALDLAADTLVPIPANAAALGATDVSGDGPRPASYVGADAAFLEPGAAPDGPTSRPHVDQPLGAAGSQWKPPKSKTLGVRHLLRQRHDRDAHRRPAPSSASAVAAAASCAP